ncbi:putative long-chain-fatty-acid--CoA ligase [Bacillus clarus]|uniref:Putative long-chain-fatty-acid--CoA ligase n=1 Tax=Bacillus clarus TaxID=2338372 RepID=A0A090YRQ5_9BACI|nr:putative long-chain-fatty-acid--CoA ligase [Bacillus clarus]
MVNTHPNILELTVIGVPSEIGEEDVKVYVVCKAGETVLYEEII